MGHEPNIPLLVLDFIVILPITLLRLLLIYIYGSGYNIASFEILDVIMHAKNPKFNNGNNNIDTNEKNISEVLNKMINTTHQHSTQIKTKKDNVVHKKIVKNKVSKDKNKKNKKSLNKINEELFELQKDNECINSDAVHDLIKTVDENNIKKSKTKQNIDTNLNKLSNIISNTDSTLNKLSNIPKTNIKAKNKLHLKQIDISTGSSVLQNYDSISTNYNSRDSSNSNSSKRELVSLLNMSQLINTSSDSDNNADDSSFAINFPDDNH